MAEKSSGIPEIVFFANPRDTLNANAHQLINDVRFFLGEGDMQKGATIWIRDGYDDIFDELFQKRQEGLISAIKQNNVIQLLKILERARESSRIK